MLKTPLVSVSTLWVRAAELARISTTAPIWGTPAELCTVPAMTPGLTAAKAPSTADECKRQNSELTLH